MEDEWLEKQEEKVWELTHDHRKSSLNRVLLLRIVVGSIGGTV